jgi:hypothetical protein
MEEDPNSTSWLDARVDAQRVLRDEVADLASQIDDATASLHKLLADHVEGSSLRELSALLAAAHRGRATLETAVAVVASHCDRLQQFSFDGHACVRSWVAAVCHTTHDDATRIAGLAELFALIPRAEQLVKDGTLGIEQAREIVRLVRNRRISNDGIVASFDSIVDAANDVTADQFHAFITDLRDRLDADGAQRRHDTAAFHRHAHVSTVGEATYVDAMLPVLEGEFVKEVLEAFKQAEYLADIDAVRARRAPDDHRDLDQGDLPRSASQRSGDALVAVFRAAANAPLGGKPVEVELVVVIDQPSFEQQLLDLVDPFHEKRLALTRVLNALDQAAPPRDHCAGVTLGRTEGCGETDGNCTVDHAVDRQPFAGVGGRQGGTGDAIDRFAQQTRPLSRLTTGPSAPADAAVVALLFGHVRRVVVGADSVIIDAGRRRRCFTDSAKQVAVTQSLLDGYRGRCTWPGCRSRHLQTDHATEWDDLGTTSPGNADRLCAFHNLVKTGRGFTARRTTHGWTFCRPDGTAITTP